MIKQCFYKLLRFNFGEYLFYHIFSLEISTIPLLSVKQFRLGPIENIEQLKNAKDPLFRQYSIDREQGHFAYGAWVGEELAAFIVFKTRKAFKTPNLWPLAVDEIDLSQLITEKRFRGKGIGPILVQFGALETGKIGFNRVYIKTWHSNTSAQRAYKKAGCRKIAFLAEIYPFNGHKRFRFVFRTESRRNNKMMLWCEKLFSSFFSPQADSARRHNNNETNNRSTPLSPTPNAQR